MLRVVETFSGIGSQVKALKNLNIEHEIVATVEWDITAIYAYDIIHNGPQTDNIYVNLGKEELVKKLSKYTLSNGGKTPLEINSLARMTAENLSKILFAIERTNNKVSITDVHASDLPENIDLLTYSFPCQDLSICGAWHGNMTGIDREANNRSGMLWEIERILQEYVLEGIKPPKFLLMENVSNILSEAHKHNFWEWQKYLSDIGYHNQIYTLNAVNFGVPQRRIRTYMISVFCDKEEMKAEVQKYFFENNLENIQIDIPNLMNFLRVDYENEQYRSEADISNPNNTPSRMKIFEENQIVCDGVSSKVEFVRTITTKQDRNPNSGLILYKSKYENKAEYRNLTPRECFLLMGFEENDFQMLVDNNFKVRSNSTIFGREKLIKLAGNSIVVPVLEHIFKQIEYLNENIM